MQEEKMIDDFSRRGWCEYTDPLLYAAIEGLIDEIILFSHAVFDKSPPFLSDLAEKAEFLSDSIRKMGFEDRRKLAFVYDGVKNLPAFHCLYAHPSLHHACEVVLQTRALLLLKDSVGVRFDIPGEEAQLTMMHQEFHSFPVSLSGLVVWCPLTPVDRERGSIAIWGGSHREVMRFSGDNARIEELLAEGRLQEAQKLGGLVLPNNLSEPTVVKSGVGSVYLMSALTLHESVAALWPHAGARLTCQARIFSYDDPFFRWKSGSRSFSEGMKQPMIAQGMYDDWCANNGM